MLPKQYRLKGSKKFTEIYKRGKRYYSTFFTVFVLTKTPSEIGAQMPSTFGIVTSKKVGEATVRNRIRRQLTEIIRPEIPNLQGNLEVVIKVAPQVVNQSYEAIKADLKTHLQKITKKDD